VRVDGVRWEQVESLAPAAPADRVYVARLDDDGIATVTTGDGVHGGRLPTGVENVESTYRVGIGGDGAMAAGQLSLLPRRPLGIAAAGNPSPSHDWAAPEDLETARTLAPQRIRTLDRAVSVADHEDFASVYAGVALARADPVWNGRERVVVVSVLGTEGRPPGAGLVAGLSASLTAARDAGSPFAVRAGEVVGFAVRVALRHYPAYVRADVERAVVADLMARYAPGATPFGAAVVAARLLVEIRAVPGVAACTMPALVHVTDPDEAEHVLLAALPGRFLPASGELAGAQALALTGGVTLEVMP
jgi:predicted phage baseplate assembly protein